MAARVGVRKRTHAVAATFEHHPLSDRDQAWDPAAAETRVREWAGAIDEPTELYATAFLWHDRDAPEKFSSYRLPFVDIIDGEPVAVWKAISLAAGLVFGANGGTDIPELSLPGIRSAIGHLYTAGREAFADDTITAPWGTNVDVVERPEHQVGDGVGAVQTMYVRIRPDVDELESHVGRAIEHGIAEGLRAAFGPDAVLPAEMQPSDVRPEPSDTVTLPEPNERRGDAGMQRWQADLVPEGKITDDGRLFAPGSISWRGLPLSLMAMTQTPGEGGHAGAELAGRIDRIWRDESVTPTMIRAEGVFDDSEFGNNIARLVGDQTLRGNSVDLAIREAEFGPRTAYVDENGLWRDDAPGPDDSQDIADLLFGDDADDLIMVARDAVIGMSTVCPFPAFEDAGIVLAAATDTSPEFAIVPDPTGFRWRIWLKDAVTSDAEVLTASAAGLAPLEPPADWFADPELDELTAITITDDGRIFGHAAEWGTCHIGIPGACTTPPVSMTEYEYFLLKELVTVEGETVAVGTITLGTGHAGDRLNKDAAAEHYDNTGAAVADVVVGEDSFGIWVSGALRPDLPAARVRELRGSVLSGDWRRVNGNLELVGLLAVNVPGFPVPRTKAVVVASGAGMEVLSLVASGIHDGRTQAELEQAAKARLAALAARANGGLAGLAELAGQNAPAGLEQAAGQRHLRDLAARVAPDPTYRDHVRAALVAAGVEESEAITTTFELTQGGMCARTFYSLVIAESLDVSRRGEWPSEATLGDHGEVIYREENGAVFRIDDGTLVLARVGGGWASFQVAAKSIEKAAATIDTFCTAYPPLYHEISDDGLTVPITFWTNGKFGPTSRLRMIDSASWADIDGNYTAEVHAELERLMAGFEPGKDGQLLLWQGPPGTGKTWALRALATEWSPWAEFNYITDPDAFFVSDPAYMIDVLMHDSYEALTPDNGVVTAEGVGGKWRVLILEDTGELLSANAKEAYGQGLSRLLNVVDGMVGQGLRILALVTTNDELGDLHPAAVRPGRCASQISFGPLTPSEGAAWLGVENELEQPATLAELFEMSGRDPAATVELADGEPEGDEPATGVCSDCGHDAMEHAGTDNMGACTVEGCDCAGYVA